MDLSTQKKEPLVSVLISVLNDVEHIEETILSVLSQQYSNKELVIIDGGSTDGTVDLIKKYEKELSFFISEPDNGIYNGFNKGIKHCNGDWVKILNSGDFFSDEHSIDQMVAIANKHEDIGLIYSPILMLSKEGKHLQRDTQQFFKCSFKIFPSFFHPSWFVHRSVYQKLGEYNESYGIASDYEYYLKILEANIKSVFCEDLTFVSFRAGGASSGFIGIKEVFWINKKYKGVIAASYVFLVHMLFKVASKFKMRVINTKKARKLIID